MKSCPKCNRSFENSLDFCLEDGSRLTLLSDPATNVTTESKPLNTAQATVAYPITPVRNAANELAKGAEVETVVAKKEILGVDAVSRSNVVFEYAAVAIALAHNWWQWLYLEKQYYSSFFDYVFSANFLMWLLLLVGGAMVSLFVIRKSSSKTFGVVSLVILAINLLLFLVPRR